MKVFQRKSNKIKWLRMICVWAMLVGILQQNSFLGDLDVNASETNKVISIDTQEELSKIGVDPAYPMDGDYVLNSDLDMGGISFTPIGGTSGTRGAVSGSNVFSGTFDGQGHLISNLSIEVSETMTNADCAQIGLFSSIASESAAKTAEVKNLVLADVRVTADISGTFTAAGALAGEVNGYASISNICILSGLVTVNGSNQSDTVGAGGVIGECRTSADMGNRYIRITNVYNGADLLAGSLTGVNYAGGIIGRVSKSACQEISGCVNVGQTSFKGDLGMGITNFNNADSSCLTDSYFLFDTGRAQSSTELTEQELFSGSLPKGLNSRLWYAAEGYYPLLQICQNEGTAGYLALADLAPVYAEGEDARTVTQDFTLPLQTGGVTVQWESSHPDIIFIDEGTARVSSVLSDTKVTLRAFTDTGLSKIFSVTVVSGVKAVFEQNYAKPGTPLTVEMKNAPEDMVCTYSWSVGDKSVGSVSENSYTPEAADLEKFIKVVVEAAAYHAKWELSVYCSELPVVYIDTDDGNDVTDKNNYKNAELRLQGNEEFSKSSVLYDGAAEIKGRGNSTWDYAAANGLKKPYKLKLDKKADILGMGKNKHWVLMANVIDHTNMRNQLVGEFSRDIGMECFMDSKSVVLVLNGSYQGMYQLGEQKRVGDTRINVFDWEGLGEEIADAIAKKENFSDSQKKDLEEHMKMDFGWFDTGATQWNGKTYRVTDYYKDEIPQFTGGFVYDMDFRLNDSKYVSKFWTDYGYPMFFEAPEYAKSSNAMMTYGRNYLQAFEDAVHSDDYYASFDNQKMHYSELFDMDSLVQNWFVVEYSMNWDSMKNSTLMYKDLEGPIKMGPAWDYDWCWGNINMYSMTGPYVIEGWHSTQDSFCEQNYQRENWNRYLISDPYFATLVYEKWQEIRTPVIEEMIKDGGKIDTLEDTYRTAAKADEAKWSYSYNRYSGYGLTDGHVVFKQSEKYEDAVNSMKYFIQNRVAWFDTKFTSVDSLLDSWGRYHGSDQLQVSDIQFTESGETSIRVSVSNSSIKKAAFYVNGIHVGDTEVTDGKADILVADSYLRDKNNASNTVQVRGLDGTGKLLKSGNQVITNYKNFQKEVLERLTGTVLIQGDPVCGSLLKAKVTDTNNTGELSYQWMADGAPIPGADGESYLLTKEEAGKKLQVQVTGSKQAGSLLSDLTNEIKERQLVVQKDHLIIHQVYGTGAKEDTPLSHNFIELYNPTESDISLETYTIGYLSSSSNEISTTGGTIVKKKLGGVLPSHCSYLIRCASDKMADAAYIHEIPEGDLEWSDRVIDNKQYQILLYENDQVTDALSVGEEAVEGVPFSGVSKQKSARRIGFSDSDDNSTDFEIIAYNDEAADYITVKPRSAGDGPWGLEDGDPDIKPEILKGRLEISGTAQSGKTLTAVLSECNSDVSTLCYEWKEDGAEIPNMYGSSFLLTDAQIGKRITVSVVSSERPGILESMPTDAVKKAEISGEDDNPDNPGNEDTENPGQNTAEAVTLNPSSYLLPKNGWIQLKAAVHPANAANTALKWSSSDTSIAAVDAAGRVTGKKKGTAVITVKTGNGKQAKAFVTVSEVKLKVSAVKMQKGTSTTLLGIKEKYPTGDKVQRWTSSKEKVAAVSKTGKVKAKKTGTSIITVTMKSGASASYKLTVTKGAVKTKKLSSPKKTITLRKNKTYRIKITRSPLTANDRLTFTSTKKTVAAVSKKGMIKGIKKGECKVKVKTSGGRTMTLRVRVR